MPSNPFLFVMAMCAVLAPLSLHADEGLGRTWAKLARDQKLTIGYFGGSITEGAGSSNANLTCWRALTTAWFKQQFPQAQITEINAAVGGTGSELGAFRCPRDLLSHQPDLVFVEFAVNDSKTPEAPEIASMEGIVRQVLKSNPAADIVFVYTTCKDCETYSQGVNPPAVRYQQEVADHYGIPSVNIGKALWEVIHNGQGTWPTLTIDTVHPNDKGYAIYTKAMIDFLTAHRADAPVAPAPLPAALSPAPMEHPQELDAWTLKSTGWTQDNESLMGRYPHRLSSNTPGATLDVPFHGSIIGMYWGMSPDSGKIDYSVDDGPTTTVSAWDVFALKSSRANYLNLARDLKVGDHVLHMKISPAKDDKSSGTWIRIGAFFTD